MKRSESIRTFALVCLLCLLLVTGLALVVDALL